MLAAETSIQQARPRGPGAIGLHQARKRAESVAGMHRFSLFALPRIVLGLFLWSGGLLAVLLLHADPARSNPSPFHGVAPPLLVSLVDRLGPQGLGPAFQTLDERRRGPLFAAALAQVSQAGKLPPVTVINRDLSLASAAPDESELAAGTRLVRIYLTDWTQTRQGGSADSEILCRFYAEVRYDGRVERKLGPFFARRALDTTTAARPQDRWVQYQAVARQAIEQMAEMLEPR